MSRYFPVDPDDGGTTPAGLDFARRRWFFPGDGVEQDGQKRAAREQSFYCRPLSGRGKQAMRTRVSGEAVIPGRLFRPCRLGAGGLPGPAAKFPVRL